MCKEFQDPIIQASISREKKTHRYHNKVVRLIISIMLSKFCTNKNVCVMSCFVVFLPMSSFMDINQTLELLCPVNIYFFSNDLLEHPNNKRNSKKTFAFFCFVLFYLFLFCFHFIFYLRFVF